MTTLTVNGTPVTVDDSFLKLSPADQESTVNEIASHIAAAPAPPASSDDNGLGAVLDAAGTAESAAWKSSPVGALAHDALGVAGGVNEVANAVAHAVPLGDRISAGLNTLPVIGTGHSYADNLAAERAQAAEGWKRNPALQYAAGGLVAAAIPTGGLGPIAAGAVGGGLYGAGEGLSNTEDLTKSLPQDAFNAGVGGVAGATVGAALPAGVGKVAKVLANKFNPQVGDLGAPANTLMADAINGDGGATVAARANELGDKANVMDASTNALALGMATKQSLGLKPSAMTAPLAARSAQAPADIASGVEGAIGKPPPSAVTASRDLFAQMGPFAAAKDAALKGAGDVDIAPVIKTIDDALPNVGRGLGLRSELQAARTALTEPAPTLTAPPPLSARATYQEYQVWKAAQDAYDAAKGGGQVVPTKNAQVIQSVIDDLANKIDWTPNGTAVNPLAAVSSKGIAALKDLRAQLSAALGDQVNGYGAAMQELGPLQARRAAIGKGQESLSGQNPVDFAREYGPVSQGPVRPGPNAVQGRGLTPIQEAQNTGARAEMTDNIGQRVNKLSAVKTLQQGGAGDPITGAGAGNNSENLGTMFGTEAQKTLDALVERQGQFANTAARISAGSDTAPRQVMSQKLGEAIANKPLIGGHVSDVTEHGIKLQLAKLAINQAAKPFQNHVNPDEVLANLARGLNAQGPARNKMIADALTSASRTVKNQAVASRSAHAAALAAQLGVGAASNRRATQ